MIVRKTTLAALGLWLLAATPSAFAGSGEVTTAVTPLSASVTYSTEASVSPARPALVTYVGWKVAVASALTNTNTINNVRFTATASVTDPAEKAVFSSADGATCVTTVNPATAPNPGVNDGTSIECTLGQLRAGQAYPTFAVFFVAPLKAVNGVADGEGQDLVSFSGIAYYAEGTGGLENSVPQNSTVNWASDPVTLGTFNPTTIRSAVPKGGGKFFTGDGVAATAADKFATTVTVVPAPTYSTGEIVETDVTADINCASRGNFVNCYRSTVTIPDIVYSSTSGSYLTIVLSIDATNIVKGAKITDVLIQYFDGLNTHNVGLCASPTTPRTDGIPCIASRVHFRNKSVDGWTSDTDGDFAITLLNLRNGGYTVF